MKRFIKGFLKKIIFPPNTLKAATFSTLLKDPLIVADVGSTGGPDYKWNPLKNNCLFLNFDPHPKAETADVKEYRVKNYPIGLWSSNEIKKLNLASSDQASSIYTLSKELLHDFLNSCCHKKIGEIDIHLKRMDSVVEKSLSPDFIKIDAEGADLDVLKGAETFIKSTVLGVQAEVSFMERHIGAPYFSDLDIYLRNLHFNLFDLSKERWIRKNNCFGIESKPQVIWGNAVYMLKENELFKRFQNSPQEIRNQTIVKYTLFLLIYRMYDYAEEIRQKALSIGFIDENTSNDLLRLINKSMPSNIYSLLNTGFCFSLLFIVASVVWPIPKLREKTGSLLKMRVRHLTLLFSNIGRFGINKHCVAEHE
jgi:FkbM family methyltransferase